MSQRVISDDEPGPYYSSLEEKESDQQAINSCYKEQAGADARSYGDKSEERRRGKSNKPSRGSRQHDLRDFLYFPGASY